MGRGRWPEKKMSSIKIRIVNELHNSELSNDQLYTNSFHENNTTHLHLTIWYCCLSGDSYTMFSHYLTGITSIITDSKHHVEQPKLEALLFSHPHLPKGWREGRHPSCSY